MWQPDGSRSRAARQKTVVKGGSSASTSVQRCCLVPAPNRGSRTADVELVTWTGSGSTFRQARSTRCSARLASSVFRQASRTPGVLPRAQGDGSHRNRLPARMAVRLRPTLELAHRRARSFSALDAWDDDFLPGDLHQHANAGLEEIETIEVTCPLDFRDEEEWWAWSWSHGTRSLFKQCRSQTAALLKLCSMDSRTAWRRRTSPRLNVRHHRRASRQVEVDQA